MISHSLTIDEVAECPMHGRSASSLQASDVLVLETPKRMVVQYSENEQGEQELNLYYADKEVSFDEPELFAFGETLARQSRFTGADAMTWGSGYSWAQVAPLLEALLAEGVLVRASALSPANHSSDRQRPSPLSPARTTRSRTWDECEAITQELTGRRVERGYLELVVPVFRIAHPELDADGRQVGEANVFPRALRLDAPTEWSACIYAGTRHMSQRPMNVTALKTMREHWPQMMAALLHLRSVFLKRRPDIGGSWKVGDIEQLATFVLAVPTYLVMKKGAAARPLHPVLSSLFRVTDGLRMVTHQMMFVPIGEPPLPFDTVMTPKEIHDYAERNYSFYSETGVCAGPKHFVQMFLETLIDGAGAARYGDVAFDGEVAAALEDADAAFDYALHALRGHAALFRFWPIMSRAYEQIGEIASEQAARGLDAFVRLDEHWQPNMHILKTGTYLSVEKWRLDREIVYARMYDACTGALGRAGREPAFADRLRSARDGGAKALTMQIERIIAHALGGGAATNRLAGIIASFCFETQAHLRVAVACQANVNALLARATPVHAFEVDDANVHTLLQEGGPKRLPFLLDELRSVFGLSLTIATDRIEANFARIDEGTACPFAKGSAGMAPAETCALSA